MRRKFIAGNWKMHKGVDETSSLIEGLLATDPPPTVDAVVGPDHEIGPAVTLQVANPGRGKDRRAHSAGSLEGQEYD